jgi:hypothetical protein
MYKKQILQLFVFLLVCALAIPVYAQHGGMVRLGDAHVDGNVDHDSIHVGRSDGKFRAIQLHISGGAINFERVVVRFGNGTTEELPIHSTIPDGGNTRLIDLPGDHRSIESVDLWYSKASWSHHPKVTLYGAR